MCRTAGRRCPETAEGRARRAARARERRAEKKAALAALAKVATTDDTQVVTTDVEDQATASNSVRPPTKKAPTKKTTQKTATTTKTPTKRTPRKKKARNPHETVTNMFRNTPAEKMDIQAMVLAGPPADTRGNYSWDGIKETVTKVSEACPDVDEGYVRNYVISRLVSAEMANPRDDFFVDASHEQFDTDKFLAADLTWGGPRHHITYREAIIKLYDIYPRDMWSGPQREAKLKKFVTDWAQKEMSRRNKDDDNE